MLPKSPVDSMGLLEVKCRMKDSVSDVSYLKVVRDKPQLHRSHQYCEQYGPDGVDRGEVG